MISKGFITALNAAFFLLIFAASVAAAPRVVILTPEPSPLSERFADVVASSFNDAVRLMDRDAGGAAYRSAPASEPFNLSTDEAKRLGSRLGCDAYILIKAQTRKQNAFGKGSYFESSAYVFLVSSRTGRLGFWTIEKGEKPDAESSEKALFAGVGVLALELIKQATLTVSADLNAVAPPAMDEPPAEGSNAAKNFKAPIPYRRIKPEYTELAALNQVAATVEITVDLNEKGEILRTEIARWAGFGLDESVENAVRSMNWRPAERSGKFLPMRFLLRYNFKKIEKDTDR